MSFYVEGLGADRAGFAKGQKTAPEGRGSLSGLVALRAGGGLAIRRRLPACTTVSSK
jgi:hypothetical protein